MKHELISKNKKLNLKGSAPNEPKNSNEKNDKKPKIFGPQGPNNNNSKGSNTKSIGPIKRKTSPGKIFLWVIVTFFIVSIIFSIFFSTTTYAIADMAKFLNDLGDDGKLTIGDTNYDIKAINVNFQQYSESMERIVFTIKTDGGTMNFVSYYSEGSNIYLSEDVKISNVYITELVKGDMIFNQFINHLQEDYLDTLGTAFKMPITIIPYQPYTGPGFIISILTTFGPWLFFFVLAWVIIRKLVDKQQGDMTIGKSKARLQVSNVKFNDVAGYEESKIELKELVDYLKMPEKFKEVGAKTPKGILMVGPPGTGKTLFAKAVAGEANVPFFTVSGSDFVEMFIGVGASRVRNMFKTAKEAGKCLIFIDEIDAVGRARGAGVGGSNDEREQTLNQLLVEMDGFNNNSGIIVIAATNRPDVLDPALIRPGRFDRQVSLRLPDVKEREAILRVHIGTKKFSKKVELEEIAKRTPGFSGAQLQNILNEAAILAVREEQDIITTDLIDEAIDRTIGGGPAKKSKIVTPEEKKIIAYHEAGHAIVGLKLEHSQLVQKITIIPRGDAGGYVLMTPKKEKMIQTKSELIATITSYLGGRASEEIFFGKDNITSGSSSDIQSATKIARSMVTELGMSDMGPIQYAERDGSPFLGRTLSSNRQHSGTTQHDIDKEIKKIIDSALKLAQITISKHKKLLIKIADYLIEKETITSEEIRYIEKHNKMPPTDFFDASKEEKAKAKEEAKKRRMAKKLVEEEKYNKIQNTFDKNKSKNIEAKKEKSKIKEKSKTDKN